MQRPTVHFVTHVFFHEYIAFIVLYHFLTTANLVCVLFSTQHGHGRVQGSMHKLY